MILCACCGIVGNFWTWFSKCYQLSRDGGWHFSRSKPAISKPKWVVGEDVQEQEGSYLWHWWRGYQYEGIRLLQSHSKIRYCFHIKVPTTMVIHWIYLIAILMRTSLKSLSADTGSTPSQQELNDLRGVVTNLGGELSSQAESYRLVMEKCKQLEESNKLLTQSNQQLSQQMMSID